MQKSTQLKSGRWGYGVSVKSVGINRKKKPTKTTRKKQKKKTNFVYIHQIQMYFLLLIEIEIDRQTERVGSKRKKCESQLMILFNDLGYSMQNLFFSLKIWFRVYL